MFSKAFDFCMKSQSADGIPVSADVLYAVSRGYGFVTERNKREQPLLQIAELNAAFNTLYWYQETELTQVEQDAYGCYVDSAKALTALAGKEGGAYPGEHRYIPLSFKVDVEKQGNYQVELTISSPDDMEKVLVFTGRRRLAYKGSIAAGNTLQLTLAVNVCDIIPRSYTEAYADTTLDITIVADKPRISALRVTRLDVPTVYIAGDSTVTDQSASYPYAPGTSFAGWGQCLPAYLTQDIAVSNHAHSGLTTESFRSEGHYEIVRRNWKPGDYLFLQFAHNDQKLAHLKAREGYRSNLLAYIQEARMQGVFPVIVTPIARNTWKGIDNSYNDLLAEYAESCKEIGKETNVPVLDLHELSMAFIIDRGLEGAKACFISNDYTHTNDYGAYLMAGFVASQIREQCSNHLEVAYRTLADYVTAGYGEWPPAEHIVPPKKPVIYDAIQGPGRADPLENIDRLDETADRVSALDMLIKTFRFFPTNVYNDMFKDVVGHEWYAGVVECAYQNGMIPPEMAAHDCFYPQQAVTLGEFLIFAINGYQCRKPLPEVDLSHVKAYSSQCEEHTCKHISAACVLGLILADGSDNLSRTMTRQEAVKLCRRFMG